MTQPASQFVPRALIRSVPFSTPRVFEGVVVAAGGQGFGFDIGLALSDRNQLGYSTPQAGFTTIATGFLLDVSVFSDQTSTLDVLFTATTTSVARSVMTGGVPLAIAASTLTLVAGLRICGTFVTVNFVNTAGVGANVVLWAAVRSG
jgi:hypothetical protein